MLSEPLSIDGKKRRKRVREKEKEIKRERISGSEREMERKKKSGIYDFSGAPSEKREENDIRRK